MPSGLAWSLYESLRRVSEHQLACWPLSGPSRVARVSGNSSLLHHFSNQMESHTHLKSHQHVCIFAIGGVSAHDSTLLRNFSFLWHPSTSLAPLVRSKRPGRSRAVMVSPNYELFSVLLVPCFLELFLSFVRVSTISGCFSFIIWILNASSSSCWLRLRLARSLWQIFPPMILYDVSLFSSFWGNVTLLAQLMYRIFPLLYDWLYSKRDQVSLQPQSGTIAS